MSGSSKWMMFSLLGVLWCLLYSGACGTPPSVVPEGGHEPTSGTDWIYINKEKPRDIVSSPDASQYEPESESTQPDKIADTYLPEPLQEEPLPEPEKASLPEALPEKGEAVIERVPEPDTPVKPRLPTWQDDPCATLSTYKPRYTDLINRWHKQDQLSAPPKGGLVVTGSSSIRFWRKMMLELTPWKATQRGFGGAYLWDVLAHSSKLITAHAPRAVLLFAGTNDVAAKMTPQRVLTAYRCLVKKIKDGVGEIDILFIGITPTPSRWAGWSKAEQLNASVKTLADKWPGLHYIDIPTAFLKTGRPPKTSLFVADRLHLNDDGYKLWTSVIKPVLQKAVSIKKYTPPAGQPPKESRVLVDLGPNNAADGASTKNPDTFGQTWNNWHNLNGGAAILPGEALGLKTIKGQKTPWRLVVSGMFQCNGIRNGGLQKPDSKKLGTLAVGSATQDYFYVTKALPSGLAITGLDPSKNYRLQLFGSRNFAGETRVTRYTLSTGTGSVSKTLKTTGRGIGSGGAYHGNEDATVTFDKVKPDAWGKLHIEIKAGQGAYGYISLLALSVH